MNISAIIAATILVAAVGLFIGVFLGAAGKKFAVEIDEKEVAIREALPGNNCGGCGYPGCDGLAAAIAKGEAPVNRCPVGGEPVGKIIAGIMGQAAVETARQVAHVKCSGTCEKAKEEYIYTGVEDCEMLPFVPNGGAKSCTYGCCGFGSCVKVCPFDAIHIVDGIAVVDKEACKACGIYHFVETLPNGFDTILDDSITLSSGQKQLFTIARAMVQNNPMLILDEATSSVDTRTELITQKAMDRLTEHRTSFVIAHRLSTIKNADLILVLKDGDIIEQGTHESLLAKGGFYADLYNSQFEKVS